MGFSLGSIVSDVTSLVTDPGKAVKDICDAVLPSNMKAIGDIVGGAVDFETGHPLQALGHLTDALKDLPQMAQGLSTTAAKTAATPVGTAAAEPTPPPPRAPAAASVATATGVSTASQASAAPGSAPTVTVSTGSSGAPVPATLKPGEQVTIRMDANGRGVTITERPAPAARTGTSTVQREGGHHRESARSEASRRHPPIVPSATTTPPSATTATRSASGSTAGSAPAASTATTKPEATTASAGGSSATSASASGSSSAGAATSGAAGTAAAGASATPTPSNLAGLMALSPDQFMQAVTSGNIPPDVANNPAAMTQIQARMNQITQMNQLVTSMMAAMHQMQMSIIQNIRV
jgi:hypothetical protein